MTTAKAQAAGLRVARANSPGTQPTTGWLTLLPNPDGIQNFEPQFIDVANDPLSPNMVNEKSDHVGETAAPTIVHNLNKSLIDALGPTLLRSAANVPGNKGAAFYYPTAVTTTGYTVEALGDLTAKLLIYARGFATAANNGLKAVASSSASGEIKASGLAAETVSVAGSAMVEVAGIEADSAADVQLDASGNLVSTDTDFTDANLKVGHKIFMKMGTGTNEFGIISATAGIHYATVAEVPTATEIKLKWHSFTPGADAATGKTIRLYFGLMYCNYPDGDPSYIDEPAYWAELRDSGVGATNAEVYTYVKDFVVDNWSISMPTTGKVEATLALKARSISDPYETGARLTGPSTAYPMMSLELFDTSSDMLVHRLVDNTGTLLVAEIMSATFTIGHGFTPRNQHCTFGAASMIPGTIEPAVTMETFYSRATVPRAIAANTECRYEAIWKNGQAGFCIDMPAVTLRNGNKKYSKNSPVMQTIASPAHRELSTNMVAIINVPPYLPA